MKRSTSFRIDFVQEIIGVDEQKGIVKALFYPDPRRYEDRTIDGKEYVFDKLDSMLFEKKMFYEKLIESLKDKPVYYQPPEVQDFSKYGLSRIEEVRNFLVGGTLPCTLEDKSEAFLRSLEKDELGFVIVSLDVVGSTKLATTLDSHAYARVISILLYELSNIIPLFHGHVLKYTGDGFIAYFAEPSFITKHDLGLDCACALHAMVYEVINPLLEEQDYPEIGVRIGMDSGQAEIVVMGSPQTKQHIDIIGRIVSLAAKIQSCAKPGEIWLGDSVCKHLYVAWRQVIEEVPLKQTWQYKDVDGKPYPVHRLNLGKVNPEWRANFQPSPRVPDSGWVGSGGSPERDSQ
ncbi:MAG: adenylate/guanylate cyclase domain-containing protein [bacterium]|nr:adenylate/guanylate cyclase domain-containing protein [bacterium]